MYSIASCVVATAALAMTGLATRERRRRREAEATVRRMRQTGRVDLEPILVAAEDLTDALRRSGPALRRCGGGAAIRAVP